jgi:hypothetical protein
MILTNALKNIVIYPWAVFTTLTIVMIMTHVRMMIVVLLKDVNILLLFVMITTLVLKMDAVLTMVAITYQ